MKVVYNNQTEFAQALFLCYLYTEPYDNERGYKGEAACVEPDDFCSYGERRTDNG